MKEGLQRHLIGGALLLFTLFLIYFSQNSFIKPFFIFTVLALVAIALWELYEISKAKGYRPLSSLGIIGSSLLILSLVFGKEPQTPLLIFYGLMVAAFSHFLSKDQRPLLNLSITFFGLTYIALPLSCILLINYAPGIDGRVWLLYALLVTKSADVAAYYGGSLFGKRPLAPFVSPKKTVEGALFGLASSLIVSLLFTSFFPILSDLESIALGLTIGIMSQFGDLAESLLKRDALVKDSSRLPGLGGILDLCDSLVFTLPLVYFALRYL
jgi:phosphatidate cytidylyltransferase